MSSVGIRYINKLSFLFFIPVILPSSSLLLLSRPTAVGRGVFTRVGLVVGSVLSAREAKREERRVGRTG